MVVRLDCTQRDGRGRSIATAASAARRGDVVLVPTESSYALATDAFSVRGVRSIRWAKGQMSQVPLPVMVPSVMTVGGIAAGMSMQARALMSAFWPGALTLLVRAQPTLAWDLPADAPLAVRMPLQPVLLELLDKTGPLVVTAANAAGLSAPLTLDEAIEQLGEAWVVALDAGPIAPMEPSTVVDVTGEGVVIRRHGGVSADLLREICPDTVDAA
ncbi:MAG: threonylcarbamoyl-AMP synthase [Actinobacteria bacterium]|nr:threonylcarbamoyl-AMP synthase [Actinomycetota bacterium]